VGDNPEPYLIPLVHHLDERGDLQKFPSPQILWSPESSILDSYISRSRAEVFRGLHCQVGTVEQHKAFTVLEGQAHLFAVLLSGFSLKRQIKRRYQLDASSKTALVVPPGWATGYLARDEGTTIWAISSSEYQPENELIVNPACLQPWLDLAKISLSVKDSWGGLQVESWMGDAATVPQKRPGEG